MRSAAFFTSLVGLAAATPVRFPLADGFPNPNPANLRKISKTAGGTLSNAGAPMGLNNDTLTSFKLIAFNEIFEVAFFTELVANITNNVPGYELPTAEREGILGALTAVVAQEELHAINANNALKANNVAPIEPCQYKFPVCNFKEAIVLAQTFTDVVLGTLGDVQLKAVNTTGAGAAGVARAVAATLGQEGQQDGFYRALQLKRPSAQPFLTASIRDFAFTAITQMTVPGTCPNQASIPLKAFRALTLLTPDPKDGELQFSVGDEASSLSASGNSLAYINGQNVPVVVPITVTAPGVFTAEFPQRANIMDGLTIAAVITGQNASTAQEVANKTVWGPAFIEVN